MLYLSATSSFLELLLRSAFAVANLILSDFDLGLSESSLLLTCLTSGKCLLEYMSFHNESTSVSTSAKLVFQICKSLLSLLEKKIKKNKNILSYINLPKLLSDVI